jgi:hypothetical protein
MVSGDFPHVKFGFLCLVHQNGTALPVLVMAEAAPSPLLRFENEAALYWILMHVAKLLRTFVMGVHEVKVPKGWPAHPENPRISLGRYCDYYGGSIPFRMIGDPFLRAYN